MIFLEYIQFQSLSVRVTCVDPKNDAPPTHDIDPNVENMGIIVSISLFFITILICIFLLSLPRCGLH